MNNEIDLLDELEREERDERLAANGGGAGAALGVLLTMVIGCGLVFAAYKLGQRKTVDEPPLIAANELPIKVEPIDVGGAIIPNTDNFANAMIDGSCPALAVDGSADADYVLRDGVIVEGNLPDRTIDQASINSETREIRREVTQLTDLATKNSIDGEPSLAVDGVPDRTNELNLVAGAEIAPGSGPSLDDLVAQGAAEQAAIATAAITPLETTETAIITPIETVIAPVDTVIATATPSLDGAEADAPQGTKIAMRMPTPKPALGRTLTNRTVTAEVQPSITNTLTPPDLAPQRVRPAIEPAIARITPTPPAVPRTPQLAQPVPQLPTNPAVRQVRIPPQPIGDAQVQLGAHASPQEVRGRWAAIKGRNGDLLGPLGLKVTPVQTADGRQLFLMRVGPLRDAGRAAQLCQALAGRGIDCFVPERR